MTGIPAGADAAAALARRVEAALQAIAALGPAVAATPPLPEGARLAPDEDAWGPREVLAHVAEAVTFWQAEIERILAARPGPRNSAPAFGRAPDDALRVALIARDHGLPAAVLLARLERDGDAAVARIARLTPAELARVGRHPAWGEITVAGVVERTLASHLEGHAAQLRDSLGHEVG